VSDLSSTLAPHAHPGGYVNFLGSDCHDQIADAYGDNALRLREIKPRYDPDNVFSSAIPLPDLSLPNGNAKRIGLEVTI